MLIPKEWCVKKCKEHDVLLDDDFIISSSLHNNRGDLLVSHHHTDVEIFDELAEGMNALKSIKELVDRTDSPYLTYAFKRRINWIFERMREWK